MTGWIKVATFVAVAATLAMATGGAGAASSPGGGTKGGVSASARGTLHRVAVKHAALARPTTKAVATAAARRAASRRSILLRHADLKTLAGAKRYLRAIGVDPRGVVIQRGVRNYAGPSCPGAGWACTSTAHPVVQIATAGGKNTFLCTTGSCVVVQATSSKSATRSSRVLTAAAATNMAKCNKTTGLMQSCVINQPNATADNVAIVVERAKQASSLDQMLSAQVTAQITQSQAPGSNGNNQACVYQEITETLAPTNGKKGADISTMLDGRQSVSITQDANGGDNTVQNAAAPPATAACVDGPLTQTQTLASRATGTAKITQNENTTAPPNQMANVSLTIKQNMGVGFESAAGANKANFSQTSNLSAVASTPLGPVIQNQSTQSGGISATVNQRSSGLSTAVATQTETQCEHAQSSGTASGSCTTGSPLSYITQNQVGPIGGGAGTTHVAGGRTLAGVKKGTCPPDCSTQTGNPNDSFTVNQTSTQNNDNGQGSQTNFVSGDFSSSGSGSVTQTTNVDGSTSTNTQSGSSVNTQTNCSGSTCTSTGGVLTLLPNGLSITNTDVAESGYGGMRGTGTGSIAVSGVSGPVTHAFLYWNGPTNSNDPNSNASVTFNGTPVTGTNIGTASPNCWSFSNSQSYRADVTSLVTGTGTYSLSNFVKADADINGVSLIVFYNDTNAGNDRNIVLWNGNDSNFTNGTDPAGWDEMITGVPANGTGTASLDVIASDGQTASDDEIILNGTSVVPQGATFSGDSTPSGPFNAGSGDQAGDLWDVKTGLVNIAPFLTTPSNNTLHLTSGASGSDCVSLVVLAANVSAH